MRWVVELPAPSGGTAATVTVDADSWAGALTHARGGTAIKKFKCEFDGDGVVRVLDLESRGRFLIRPLRAGDSVRPAAPEPAAAAPAAPETAPVAPAPAVEAPALAAPVAPVVEAPPAAPAVPETAAATPAAPETAVVSAPTAEAAPTPAAETAPKVTDPSPETAPVAATPPVAVEAPSPVSASAPSGDALPTPTLLFERDEEPSQTMPLVYRERVFSVPAGTTAGQAEQIARQTLALLRRALATRPRGRYVMVAVFDHSFATQPEAPPVLVLRWKDWRGEPEIQLRPPLPARPASLAPAGPAEPINGVVHAVVAHEAPPAPEAEPSIVVEAEPPAPAAPVETAAPVAPSPEAPAAPEPVAAAPVQPVEAAPAPESAPAAAPAPAPEPAASPAPEPAGPEAVEAAPPEPATQPTPAAQEVTPIAADAAAQPAQDDGAEEGGAETETESSSGAEADTGRASSPGVSKGKKKKKRGRNRTPSAEVPAATPSLIAAVQAEQKVAEGQAASIVVSTALNETPPAAAPAAEAPATPAAASGPAALPVPTGPFKRGKDLLSDLFDELMDLSFAPDAGHACALVARIVHAHVAASVVTVSQYDIDRDEFAVVAVVGGDHLLGRRHKAKEGAIGTVVRRRQTVSLPHCDALDALDGPYTAAPTVFAGAFHQGRIFALLSLARCPGAKVFESDETDAATYVAGQLGEVLSHHAVHAAVREYPSEAPGPRRR